MKIGQIVRNSIPAILVYCETQDRAEIARLQDPRYSKETFDINYPFCKPVEAIGETERVRYWTREHVVCGVAVRVTSQWFNPPTSNSLQLLDQYLEQRKIEVPLLPNASTEIETTAGFPRAARGRYKGNAIGNAQNALVRNILTVVHKPRLLSDNGSSYVAADLADYFEDKGMVHVRGVPHHPQAA